MPNLQKIKQIASEKNISMGALAEKINMTPTGLSKIMRENATTVATLEKIVNALQVSPTVFFDLSFDMFHENSNNVEKTVAVPKEILEMLAEKDRQLAEKDKSIAHYVELLLANK